MDRGPERFLPELPEPTSRAFRRYRYLDEMEETGKKATTKGKEWEALVLEKNTQQS